MTSPHDFGDPIVIEIQRRVRRDDFREATFYQVDLGPDRLCLSQCLSDGASAYEREELADRYAMMVADQLRPLFRQMIEETARES